MNTFVKYYCNHRFQHVFFKIEGWLERHRKNKTVIIWTVFLFLSFLMGAVMTLIVIMLHGLPANDFIFHYQRIVGLSHLNTGLLTSVGYPHGMAWNVFYPWLTLVPFALLMLGNAVTEPTELYVCIGVTFYLSAYLASFYSSRTYWKSDKRAFLFSLLYTNTASIIYSLLFSEDVGVMSALVFLPLAFFGFLALAGHGRWLMLSIGMTMIIYSHVLSAVIIAAFLAVLLIAERHQFTAKEACALLKAAVLTVLLTAPYWLPMLRLVSRNAISYPPSDTGQSFAGGFTSYAGCAPGVILPVLAVIVFIVAEDKMKWTSLDKALLVVTLFGAGINTHLIGEGLSDLLPFLRIFQFSYRFDIVSDLASVWLIVRFLTGYTKPSYNALFGKFCVLITMLALPFACMTDICQHLSRAKPYTPAVYRQVLYHRDQSLHRITSRQIRRLAGRPLYTDYSPKRALRLDGAFPKRVAVSIRNGHIKALPERIKIKSDRIEIYTKHDESNVALPVVIYKGVSYRFSMNGHRMPASRINMKLTNKYQLLTLKRMPVGRQYLRINR